MSVVKANAYGHGMLPIAKKLQDLGTDYFAVAYGYEAVELRNAGIIKPILVLHPQVHELEEMIKRCVEPVLYSLEMLKAFNALAKANNQEHYPVHLEFNTGLNRLGMDDVDLDQCIAILKDQELIKVKGIQSHLASSDDPAQTEFTELQVQRFNSIATRVEKELGYSSILHLSNTSAVLNYKNARFNMVRSGIGLYGYANRMENRSFLRPIASLKSTISQMRWIKAGETISYNRLYKATKRTKYAVVALGHGDGINRIYGNSKGYVFIKGEKAAILGIVCMDMLMVDVTAIDCEVGEDVVLFNEHHTAAQLAEHVGTISYELLTGIQKRVPRVYLNQ